MFQPIEINKIHNTNDINNNFFSALSIGFNIQPKYLVRNNCICTRPIRLEWTAKSAQRQFNMYYFYRLVTYGVCKKRKYCFI